MNCLEWSQLIANYATILGVLGLIFIVVQLWRDSRRFKYDVMINCINRFQPLVARMNSGPATDADVREYLEITNEELFYFQKKYIPKEVIVEWLDGMIDGMPIFEKGSNLVLNPDKVNWPDAYKETISSYKRIINAFSVEGGLNEGIYTSPINPEESKKRANERKTLMTKIARNLGLRGMNGPIRKYYKSESKIVISKSVEGTIENEPLKSHKTDESK